LKLVKVPVNLVNLEYVESDFGMDNSAIFLYEDTKEFLENFKSH
jgi:hypothetical protein